MSTVITDGYKLKRKLSLDELQQFSMELRNKMEETAVRICERLVAERIADMVDTFMARGEEELKGKYGAKRIDIHSPLFSEAYWDLFQEHGKFQRKEICSDPDANFDCTVVFFPYKRKLLAIFLYSHQEYRDAWESLELVEEYKYYNNVDRPKGISKGRWERRSKVWNEVLPGAGIPALNGMEVKCVFHMPMAQDLNKEEIVKFIPSIEKRVHTQARDILFQLKWEELKETGTEEDSMRLTMKTERWLRSDEGQQAILEKAKTVSQILKPNIELEDLKQKISSFSSNHTEKQDAL